MRNTSSASCNDEPRPFRRSATTCIPGWRTSEEGKETLGTYEEQSRRDDTSKTTRRGKKVSHPALSAVGRNSH